MIGRVVAFGSLGVGVLGGLLFGSAGRLDVPALWAYVALWAIYMTCSSALTLRRNPDLVAERMKPPSDRDRLTRRLAALPGLGHWVVAGLDIRYGWSDLSWTPILGGFAAITLGMAFITWTFLTNRFASSAVRMQPERGHQLIDTGPYALVRHPMYLGVLLISLGSGPALGSWWAALMLAPIIPIFVRRTLLEDRMLHRELPGYPDYARRTRYRVIPGVF